MKETSAILLIASDSRTAIKTLYHFTKSQRDNFSLGHILAKTGIPSRGYLSMVLNGKKTLGAKYLASFSKLFALTNLEFRLLEVLVQIDLAKSDKSKSSYLEELGKIKMELSIVPKEVKSHFASYVLLSEIFCSLSLFEKAPTKEEILSRFSHRDFLDVESALAELENLKIIERNPVEKRYHQLQKKVSWIKSDNPDATIQGIQEIYKDGVASLPKFFSSREMSLYLASIVSTDWTKFIKILPKLREEIYRLESEIESESADSLVRFNVQVYPVTMPKKS